MSRMAGYTERFIEKHEAYTTAQLEKLRDELLHELEELADAEELHSYQYAEADWEYDLIHEMLQERKAGSDRSFSRKESFYVKNGRIHRR